MKKYILAVFALFCGSSAFSQDAMNLLNLSQNDLKGTARTMSMGNAFGALGGDIGGIAINPAGIGVYKSSEVVTTMNFNNNRTQTNLNAGRKEESRFTFRFDNFGFVSSIPLNSDAVPYLNIGFSYNQLRNFNRRYTVWGDALKTSLTDYMADRANMPGSGNITADNALQNADWMGVLGYRSGLIQRNGNGLWRSLADIDNALVNNSLFVSESGSTNSYDFNLGTTINDIVSLGFSLSLTDVNYRLYSDYYEELYNTDGGGKINDKYTLENFSRIDGTGIKIAPGIIFKPVKEFRIGAAYHSPTWYRVTEFYSAILDNIDTFSERDGGDTFVDYDYRTPDRWVFSMAGIIGSKAILSMDYELTNYKNAQFMNIQRNNSFQSDQNAFVKQEFRNTSTLRFGAEYRITPQFSIRAGYAWLQSPIDSNRTEEVAQNVMTAGTISHFTVNRSTNYYTYGLGYRFNRNFYTDVAFVIKNQKDDLYSFPDPVDAGNRFMGTPRADLTTNQFSGLLTLGYKF